MSEGQDPRATQGHQNPDYYAETASLGPGPHPLQSHPPTQGAVPTGPTSQYAAPQNEQYYPPPPPGPPPNYGNQQPYYFPVPGAPDQHQQQQQHQQPSYAPPGPGATVALQFPPPPTGADVPPPMSPRPSAPASAGQASGTAAGTPSKPSFRERFHQWTVKAGVPVNKLTNKLGSEAFWPSTLDLECDKAARILKSFCKDGFYADAPADPAQKKPDAASPGPKNKPKVLVKIPPKAIQTAAGLAIFTTFRTGLHFSGAGGSGVVVARLPDGRWSPPSGFLVHTLGAGFMIGLDIYDCVCVLRTPEAVRAFTHPRVSLGAELGLVAGPVGAGASVEAAIGKSTKPVWSYMKSRGFYAGVQADGTIIIGRPDANGAFYGVKGITADRILRGEVPAQGPPGMWPVAAKQLIEVLKSSEGRKDVDEGAINDIGQGPTPGDLGMADSDKEVVYHGKGEEGVTEAYNKQEKS